MYRVNLHARSTTTFRYTPHSLRTSTYLYYELHITGGSQCQAKVRSDILAIVLWVRDFEVSIVTCIYIQMFYFKYSGFTGTDRPAELFISPRAIPVVKLDHSSLHRTAPQH